MIDFFLDNWKIVAGVAIIFFLGLLWLILTLPEPAKKPTPHLIFCPLRQKYFPKYDVRGKFTEEYQRVRLIIYFLKKGYPKSWFKWEYPIEQSFGHKGQSKIKILVDLVIKRGDKFLVVAEIKKDYHPVTKQSAIQHQLKPAMQFTNSQYGIYWDGTRESCLLSWSKDRNFQKRKFP